MVVMINVKTSEIFFIEENNQIRNVNAGTIVATNLASATEILYTY
jgi:hypothetical protein